MNEISQPRINVRKLVIQLVLGMLTGIIVTYGALTLLDGRSFDAGDPSRMLALAVGLVFAIIGVVVALGAAMPGAGAKVLNVDDADEIREQRGLLRSGAAIYVLMGAGLLALALGGPDGTLRLLSLEASAIAALACFVLVVILSIASNRQSDELMRAIGREASVVSLYAITALALLWSVLGNFGRAPDLSAIGVLAGILGVQMAATMVVIGRRGMLAPHYK